MEQKRREYQAHWDRHRRQVTQALSDAFSLDCSPLFEDMTGCITLNPVAPRYLEKRSFDVFYLNSHRGALGMALHEIIHFVWFARWQEWFRDDPAGYERPNLPWILSEMAVEPVMRDPRLRELNPYFDDGGCVYACFYTMTVEGRPVLEILGRMYQEGDIRSFMERAYALCRRHENDIRRQMADFLA